MEDLIVIILTLVIAGFGALAQIKKKKEDQSNTGEQKKNVDFWDLIEDDPDPVVHPDKFADVEEAQVEPAVSAKSTWKDLSKENKFQPEENGILATPIKKQKSKLKRDFSLRKAVIYSEILNKKYT